MEKRNEIQMRSYALALRIYKICKALEDDKTARIISNQLLRSGTSVGANVEEAIAGQSKKDFIYRMSIALKEARETNYWLRILKDTETIGENKISDILNESSEIIKILAKIIITSKKKPE